MLNSSLLANQGNKSSFSVKTASLLNGGQPVNSGRSKFSPSFEGIRSKQIGSHKHTKLNDLRKILSV